MRAAFLTSWRSTKRSFTWAHSLRLARRIWIASRKNLLLRDDKKRAFFLVSVWGEKRLDLKAFRKAHGTRPLTFASDEDLSRLLALTPGSVTPLGLLNAAPESVRWFIDADFFSGEGIIGVHPNDNTATIFLTAADLVDLLRSEGHSLEVTTL